MVLSCHCCGLIQKKPHAEPGSELFCVRCLSTINVYDAAESLAKTRSAALAALICFPMAISLPALSIQKFGFRHETSILSGIMELVHDRYYFIAGIVFACSIIFPFLKLSGLFIITSSSPRWNDHRKALTYRMIEWTGRYGMIDVLLIAVLVALLKIGAMVQFDPGPGAYAFSICVFFSLLASSFFNPHAIWNHHSCPEAPNVN